MPVHHETPSLLLVDADDRQRTALRTTLAVLDVEVAEARSLTAAAAQIRLRPPGAAARRGDGTKARRPPPPLRERPAPAARARAGPARAPAAGVSPAGRCPGGRARVEGHRYALSFAAGRGVREAARRGAGSE